MSEASGGRVRSGRVGLRPAALMRPFPARPALALFALVVAVATITVLAGSGDPGQGEDGGGARTDGGVPRSRGDDGTSANSCGQTQCHAGFEAFSTTVEVPAEVEPGWRFEYQLTVRNEGNHQLLDVDGALNLDQAPWLTLVAGEEPHRQGPDLGPGGSYTFNWTLEALDFGDNRLEQSLAATAYYDHLNPLADDEERYAASGENPVAVKPLTLALDRYRLAGKSWHPREFRVELEALVEVRRFRVEVDPPLRESLTVGSPDGDWDGGYDSIPAGATRTLVIGITAREAAEGEVRLRWEVDGEPQTTAIAVTIAEAPPPNDGRLAWFWLALGAGLAVVVLRVRPAWDGRVGAGNLRLRASMLLTGALGLLALALLLTTLQRADMVPRRWTLVATLTPLLLGGVALAAWPLVSKDRARSRRLEGEALQRVLLTALLLMGTYVLVTAYTHLQDLGLATKDRAWLTGRALGLANLALVALSVLLGLKWTTRRRWLRGRRRVFLHQVVSVAVVVIGLTHAALLVAGTFKGTWFGLLSGSVTILCFIGVGLVGTYQRPLIERYGYRGWLITHRWLATFAVAFALEHAVINGSDLGFLRWWE